MNNNRIQEVQGELDEVTSIMRQNIEKAIERDAELGVLEDKSEALVDGSLQFRNGATRLRRQMWWQDKRQLALIVLVVVIILLIIILPIALRSESAND